MDDRKCGDGSPEVHRDTEDLAVTVSQIVKVPAQTAFDAWSSSEGWNSWFTTGAVIDFREGGEYANDDKDRGTYRKIRQPGQPGELGEPARIEFTWENTEHCPGSRVTVQFQEKGPETTLIVLTHDGLPDQKGLDGMLEGWTWAMTSLKSWLETGRPVKCEE